MTDEKELIKVAPCQAAKSRKKEEKERWERKGYLCDSGIEGKKQQGVLLLLFLCFRYY